jgi:hypothetical protein
MPAVAPASRRNVIDVSVMVERLVLDKTVELSRLEQVLKFHREQLALAAEEEWWEAMNATQTEMEPVRAECRNDHTRSKYADLAALDAALRPIWTRHGLTVTYSTGNADDAGKIRIFCHVGHVGEFGLHVKNVHVDMPCDPNGPKNTPVMAAPHATMSALTYGKRGGLGLAFAIPVFRDDDGNAAARRPAPSPQVVLQQAVPAIAPRQSPPTVVMSPREKLNADLRASVAASPPLPDRATIPSAAAKRETEMAALHAATVGDNSDPAVNRPSVRERPRITPRSYGFDGTPDPPPRDDLDIPGFLRRPK